MIGEDRHYLVRWEIDIWANTPMEAASEALSIMRDPESLGMVFNVIDDEGNEQTVDLAGSQEEIC